jgi:hypothetical protein
MLTFRRFQTTAGGPSEAANDPTDATFGMLHALRPDRRTRLGPICQALHNSMDTHDITRANGRHGRCAADLALFGFASPGRKAAREPAGDTGPASITSCHYG